MHIIIGFLGSLVTILYLLDQLGINLGGMNPFYWYRRRAFAKKYGSDPIFSVDDKMHIAALLVIGAAKLDGDITGEEKLKAKALFQREFSISEKDAAQLFGSAAHLLAAPQLLEDQLGKLVDRNKTTFSAEQAASLVSMMGEVLQSSGAPTDAQREFVSRVSGSFSVRQEEPKGTWA